MVVAKAKSTKSSAKYKGGDKDFAAKQTLNPGGTTQYPDGQTHQPESQDAKRRIGQFTGTGEPALIKK